jgi:hypothetical protein
MKVWPIDPLVPRNLRLEVPEKLPQGLTGAFLLVIKATSNHIKKFNRYKLLSDQIALVCTSSDCVR